MAKLNDITICTCTASGRSWVRVPPEAAFFFEKYCLGQVVLCCFVRLSVVLCCLAFLSKHLMDD